MSKFATVFLLAIALLVIAPAVTIAAPRPTPTPSATDQCDEAVDYYIWFFEIMFTDDERLETLDALANDDMTTFTRREFLQHGEIMLDIADDMSDYEPTEFMEPFHEAQTDFFSMTGEILTMAADAGILTAALVYGDQVEEVGEELTKERDRLNRACPSAMDDAVDRVGRPVN